MALSERLTNEARNAQRFDRAGRLAQFPGAPRAEQVRCACDRCGTHLLAVERPNGALEGACPVCLSRQVSPVTAHHAAG